MVSVTMSIFTFLTFSKQKADGNIINTAGRQRMLSQKMSKESFLISTGNDEFRSELPKTIGLFDTILKGLIYGNSAMGLPPTTEKETLTQMKDRKSTRLNSSHTDISRMPSSA